jgi:hypothetical protein
MTNKTTNWIAGLLLAGVVAFAGCGKSDKNSAPSGAARIDLAKFSQAFPSPTTEQQGNLAKVNSGVRYRLYPDALAALDGLSNDPALTEPQKKAVADMIAGVQQAMTNAPAAPGQ